ncbi:hypothetical protein OSTOST_02195 [Ostertagia ostertagi]
MNVCLKCYDLVFITETWLNSKHDIPSLLIILSSNFGVYVVIDVKSKERFSVCEHPSVIVGDFKATRSSLGSAFLETLPAHKFKQFVVEPTRERSILDLILSNDVTLIEDVSVDPPIGSSDHSSISFFISSCYSEPQFTADWDKFLRFSQKFDYFLKKYNKSIENKILRNRNKLGLVKLLNRKLKIRSKISCLKRNEVVAVLDVQKANLLAEKFCEVFSKNDDEELFKSK